MSLASGRNGSPPVTIHGSLSPEFLIQRELNN